MLVEPVFASCKLVMFFLELRMFSYMTGLFWRYNCWTSAYDLGRDDEQCQPALSQLHNFVKDVLIPKQAGKSAHTHTHTHTRPSTRQKV